jgi:hypothetical protein
MAALQSLSGSPLQGVHVSRCPWMGLPSPSMVTVVVTFISLGYVQHCTGPLL